MKMKMGPINSGNKLRRVRKGGKSGIVNLDAVREALGKTKVSEQEEEMAEWEGKDGHRWQSGSEIVGILLKKGGRR